MNRAVVKEQIISLDKVVRLQNQASPSRFQMVRLVFQYKPLHRLICLDQALRALVNQGYQIQGSQIFLWDHIKRMFIFVGCFPNHSEMTVPYQYFQENIVQIRYKKITKQIESHSQRQGAQKRVKQRSIKQAIQKVSQWMQLYQMTDKNGKRLFTLETAAKQVGVAKKTLDDYKTQIRMAQQFKFDFFKYQSSKIGILRNFVKQTAAVKKNMVFRPPSPQAEPQKVFQAEAHNLMQQQDSAYLFHSTHSCYGSDTSSNQD